MFRKFLAFAAIVFLAACGNESVWAPDDAVARAMYRHPGPAKLTLFTMVGNTAGGGAHTSLMINASQRVIWDPAGSFGHSSIPERNDVVFGITPYVADVYTRYHARETYHVVVQELEVSPEVAEEVLRAAMAYGAVPKANCTRSTSTILSNIPAFQNIKTTYYPNNLSEQFGKIAGVTTRVLVENDSDDNSKVLEDWVPQ